MFAKDIYVARRQELCRRVGKGVILLPGNVESPFNYPNNTYNFRQDSTFMYYFGHSVPALVGVIDVESGEGGNLQVSGSCLCFVTMLRSPLKGGACTLLGTISTICKNA